MNRIEFRLDMPNRGSWNGGWSGAGRNYLKYKNLSNEVVEFLGLDKENNKSWRYSWSDGWGASVTARIMNIGEKRQKSDGFCGYDWMVNDILLYNEIKG